ncbi:MAG TPA: serine protease [Gaiellaceae bacterium]|nr:serine protease [Gaiellaceae bacterium]
MAFQKRILDTAVRIIGDVDEPRLVMGKKRGTIGTGFVVSVLSETLADVRYAYVLTAHHVIDLEPRVEIQCANPFAPGELYPPISLTDWRQPIEGLDLVVCPISENEQSGGDQTIQGVDLAGGVLPPINIPSLGTTVHYIGYLEPLDRMMVRSGTVGALEQTGVEHSDPEYDYYCHLVDCRSYQGFSGSPCFFPDSRPVLERVDPQKLMVPLPPGFPPVGSTAHFSLLCGMFTEHLDDRRPNEHGAISRYGIGILLPSLHIWEALMTKKMRDERRQWDEERKQAESESGPKLRKASRAQGDEDEFSRFEQLTKQLVNTPKPGKEADS